MRSRLVIVLICLVLLLIAWALIGALELSRSHHAGSPPESADDTSRPDFDDTAAPVRTYTTFVRHHAAEIGVERLATSDALVGLATAINELAGPDGFANPAERVALLDLSARGRVLSQTSPDDLTYADIAREAFVWASRLLGTLQTRDRPGDAVLTARVERLEDLARSIHADEPLAEQHGTVVRFFREASAIVQHLAQSHPAAQAAAAATDAP